MKTFWIVQAGIGAAAIGAFAASHVACSSSSTSTGTDADTSTETDTHLDTDTTDCFGGPCEGTGPDISCHDCACLNTSGDTPAGCADTCDNILGSTTTPDFCNGAPALMMCRMCIAVRCGVSDPTTCN